MSKLKEMRIRLASLNSSAKVNAMGGGGEEGEILGYKGKSYSMPKYQGQVQ